MESMHSRAIWIFGPVCPKLKIPKCSLPPIFVGWALLNPQKIKKTWKAPLKRGYAKKVTAAAIYRNWFAGRISQVSINCLGLVFVCIVTHGVCLLALEITNAWMRGQHWGHYHSAITLISMCANSLPWDKPVRHSLCYWLSFLIGVFSENSLATAIANTK